MEHLPSRRQNGSEPQQKDDMARKYVLLYGTLYVTIHKATCLPNMDAFSDSLRKCLAVLKPCQVVVPNRVVDRGVRRITSDPYVCVILQGATLTRTKVCPNEPNPVWDEHFEIPVAHRAAEIELVVKDNDILGAQFIGQVKIQAESLLHETIQGRVYPLLGKGEKPCNEGATLQVSLSYRPVEKDPLYVDGVGKGPDYKGVPQTYFPLQKGGKVTLYQDAHVPEGLLPEIPLEHNMTFVHGKCWEDIFQAIQDAHHLVYIAGWSIYTNITLIRNHDKSRRDRTDLSLGELLKRKAQRETARVFLLVWDDKTSHSLLKNQGVMGTHDEETKRFFKGTNVHVLLAPRYADKKVSWAKQQVVGTVYTHHQKLVIVDSQGPGNTRRLIAFIGGLDLCDGRYDTPEHPLFKGLSTTFKDDYHNATFPKPESGGPRQPWHDLHCKIEGPAVYDVLKNFEQRWHKAVKWHGLGLRLKRKVRRNEKDLIDLTQVPWILGPHSDSEDALVTKDNDHETWHVQIFRSIDSGSVKGFPKLPKTIRDEHLVSGKNIAIDMSIHTAYVKAIRSAQHFIYIENQYFIGSSFAWMGYKNAGANNLIPIELALKIVSKIKARQEFAVYVVIPMWPEGVPSSDSAQEILFFQGKTMAMMYKLIAEALKEENLDKEQHPTDYLNFFCLGNREQRHSEDEQEPSAPPPPNSGQDQAQKKRRFMIYVHAKGMIVDDEYVIIGSANINQRSMAGSRDTEIAMGAYQPHHSWAGKKGAPPRGQVYGYRRSLWAEHLRVDEGCFERPWSAECVKVVRSNAQKHWEEFTRDEVVDMTGHLILYPVQVDASGKVEALPDHEEFPDVGGKILGSGTPLPDVLTT